MRLATLVKICDLLARRRDVLLPHDRELPLAAGLAIRFQGQGKPPHFASQPCSCCRADLRFLDAFCQLGLGVELSDPKMGQAELLQQHDFDGVGRAASLSQQTILIDFEGRRTDVFSHGDRRRHRRRKGKGADDIRFTLRPCQYDLFLGRQFSGVGCSG